MEAFCPSTAFISPQMAALLTGKTVRTIHNWLDSGVIAGQQLPSSQVPSGVLRQVDLSSLAAKDQHCLLQAFVDGVKQADSGDAEALNQVGIYFYWSGDHAIASSFFEAAAKKGHADAMDFLSACYFNGKGVDKNQGLGLRWLGSAAALGHSLAQGKLRALGFEV
jgi:TPR repeat protein